jgi:hypothetical protein
MICEFNKNLNCPILSIFAIDKTLTKNVVQDHPSDISNEGVLETSVCPNTPIRLMSEAMVGS